MFGWSIDASSFPLSGLTLGARSLAKFAVIYLEGISFHDSETFRENISPERLLHMTEVNNCWVGETEYRLGINQALDDGIAQGSRDATINTCLLLLQSNAINMEQVNVVLIVNNIPPVEFQAALLH